MSTLTAIPDAIAQQLDLLRDLPDARLAAVEEIESASLDVRTATTGAEVREALVALVAAGLYLLEVDRG